METANQIIMAGRRLPRVERTVIGAGLVVAALSIHVSSLVEAERRQLTVELPTAGVWALVFGVTAAIVVRVVRFRRRNVSSQPNHPEQSSIVEADEAAAAPADDPAGYLRHLLVRQPGSIQVLDVSTIRSIEADGRYVRIHTTSGRHMAQYSLVELRGRLDPTQFVQIHRSTLVNVRCVRALRTSDYRDFDVLLDDASTLRLSRTFRPNLEAALGSRL